MRVIPWFFCGLCGMVLSLACPVADAAVPVDARLTEDDALNLHCLRGAYPQLQELEADADGSLWLRLADGGRVLYARAGGLPADSAARAATGGPDAPGRVCGAWTPPAGDDDVRASMAVPYVTEPERPPTPPGFAPGRRRSQALLGALYGADRGAVERSLRGVSWLGRRVRLSPAAAAALERVAARLTPLLEAHPEWRPLLATEGGFAWRRVAGERRLSPHAFGIAIDLNPRYAPYWRWSRERPHPRQQTYPRAIVAAFEDEGFIWGGKWHEYDLMHFEYRPELICKARCLQQAARQSR